MRAWASNATSGLAAVALVIFASRNSAYATEPTSELPTGGLVYAGGATLVTEREDIVISPGRVRARYILRNAAEETRTVLLAFALPDVDMLALDGAQVENPAYDRQNPSNYVAFSATVDGQPAEMFGQTHAFALGLVDVSAVLKGHALPFYPLDPAVSERLNALADRIKADLLGRSVVRMADGQFEPLWSLKSTLFWQQTFAAGQVRTIAISYQPIVGSAPWTADTALTLKQRYCVPDAVEAALTARAARGEPATVKWTHYLSYAGASARGSVGQYRVAVEVPATIKAYTCADGLSSAASRGGEVVLADHIAEGEVQVLFIE